MEAGLKILVSAVQSRLSPPFFSRPPALRRLTEMGG
jgi:hypothetical protein